MYASLWLIALFILIGSCHESTRNYDFTAKRASGYAILNAFYFDKGGYASFEVTPLSVNDIAFDVMLCKDYPEKEVCKRDSNNCPFFIHVEPSDNKIAKTCIFLPLFFFS